MAVGMRSFAAAAAKGPLWPSNSMNASCVSTPPKCPQTACSSSMPLLRPMVSATPTTKRFDARASAGIAAAAALSLSLATRTHCDGDGSSC